MKCLILKKIVIMKIVATVFSILLLVTACSPTPDAQQIIDEARKAAGSQLLDKAEVEFTFRGWEYGIKRFGGEFEMVRMFDDTLGLVRDVVNNEGFYREINGDKVAVVDSMAFKYSNSVNSVLYFALLPYNLNDAAVIKKYLGEEKIKDQVYHKIQITFQQEGGGKDFEDVFIYWVNKGTYFIDYLAYSYITDGGGIRFREAYNPRTVNGVRIVDYVNYKPKSEVDLNETAQLFARGELQELSKIEIVNFNVQPISAF